VHEQERSLAEQQLRQAVSANPADFWALHGFGWCKFHEGRFDEARFFMEKAVQLKPDFDAARYNWACLHGRQQRVRESVEQLRRIVANEAGNKLTLLGVSAEADFRSIQNEVEFATFFEAVGIIYRP
jgi:Flp pilus assembly protein TadD